MFLLSIRKFFYCFLRLTHGREDQLTVLWPTTVLEVTDTKEKSYDAFK